MMRQVEDGRVKRLFSVRTMMFALLLAVIACGGKEHQLAFENGTGGVRSVEGPAADPLNAAYVIEGGAVRFIDGRSEVEAAPGSATKVKTFVFRNPVYGDLDGDGDMDAALILVHQPGGSGTFYYVAAALNERGGWRGMEAVFIGDRVDPRTLDVNNGVVVVSYADRRPDEPMAAPPSVDKSRYLIVRDGLFGEIKSLAAGEEVIEGWVHGPCRNLRCTAGRRFRSGVQGRILGDSARQGLARGKMPEPALNPGLIRQHSGASTK
jgi:hypothetical protein